MNYQLIALDAIRAHARRDFAAGLGRDDHGMNPGTTAIRDYRAEWDRLAKMAKDRRGVRTP